MKKNLIYAGMLLLGMTVATGCSNEESLEQVQNGNTVLAVIENGLDARTSVNDAYEVTWTADDAFSVWSNGTKAATLTLSGEAGGTTGSFTIDNNIELTEDMVALFPTSDAMSYTFATNYTSQETDAPMAGSFADGKFSFNLLTAMVRVVVDNVPAGEAVLTISSENEVLTGTSTLSNGELSVPEDGDKEVTVTINNAEAGTLTFDVPVPVQNYANGLSVKLTSGTTEIFSKKTNAIDAAVGKIYVLDTSVLSDADALMQAFADGGEYVLSSDVTLTETLGLAVGKNVTLDLGGKTLTINNASGYGVNNWGTLSVTNGKIVYDGPSYNYAAIVNKGVVSLNNVDITSDSYCVLNWGNWTQGTTLQNHEEPTVVLDITGGEFTSTVTEHGSNGEHTYALSCLDNAKMTIENATVKGDGGVYVDCAYADLYGVNATKTCTSGARGLYVACGEVTYDDECQFTDVFVDTNTEWATTYGKTIVNGTEYTSTQVIN